MEPHPFIPRLYFQPVPQADCAPRSELGGHPHRFVVRAEAYDRSGGADGNPSLVQGPGSLKGGVDIASLRPQGRAKAVSADAMPKRFPGEPNLATLFYPHS